ncbi:hypothetical protein CASFOL_025577 [Castilleja foliolosa]|uniref:Cysteine proteinase inhibitor n=1 Tax=Castilleja foliolosa TaxID=1961234 RepID=A0ABD3CRH8_9LAMI
MNMKDKTLYFTLVFAGIVFCSESAEGMNKLGGLSNIAQNSGEIENIALFAVQQHNQKQNAVLKFGRVVKAKEQVVAGKMYYLTLEVNDGGKNKTYEAKVWVKPWMNFKQLEEFKLAHDNPSFASFGLGVNHVVDNFVRVSVAFKRGELAKKLDGVVRKNYEVNKYLK